MQKVNPISECQAAILQALESDDTLAFEALSLECQSSVASACYSKIYVLAAISGLEHAGLIVEDDDGKYTLTDLYHSGRMTTQEQIEWENWSNSY